MTNKGKKQLACRVSDETFNEVLEIVGNYDKPFKSTSEYVYTLIIKDLAIRNNPTKSKLNLMLVLKEYLDSPEGKKYVCSLMEYAILNGFKRTTTE